MIKPVISKYGYSYNEDGIIRIASMEGNVNWYDGSFYKLGGRDPMTNLPLVGRGGDNKPELIRNFNLEHFVLRFLLHQTGQLASILEESQDGVDGGSTDPVEVIFSSPGDEHKGAEADMDEPVPVPVDIMFCTGSGKRVPVSIRINQTIRVTGGDIREFWG